MYSRVQNYFLLLSPKYVLNHSFHYIYSFELKSKAENEFTYERT